MPDLSFPVTYPPTTGDLFEVADANSWLYSESSPTASLAIVNGLLDYANLDASLDVGAEYTQRGSHVYGESAAGTANLDYRWTWFGEWTNPATWAVNAYDPYQPIPGGCRTTYVKWTAMVLIMWTVHWMTDSSASDDDKSAIFLMIDGTAYGHQCRTVGLTQSGGDPYGYKKQRAWSGHMWVSLAKGWHDIGLCILADADIRQTRVYARSIVVVPFKNHAGGEAGV